MQPTAMPNDLPAYVLGYLLFTLSVTAFRFGQNRPVAVGRDLLHLLLPGWAPLLLLLRISLWDRGRTGQAGRHYLDATISAFFGSAAAVAYFSLGGRNGMEVTFLALLIALIFSLLWTIDEPLRRVLHSISFCALGVSSLLAGLSFSPADGPGAIAGIAGLCAVPLLGFFCGWAGIRIEAAESRAMEAAPPG